MSFALWWVALTAGIEDGLSPCLLMTAAIILIAMIWFKKVGINRSWLGLLILIIGLDSFIISFGVFDKFLLNTFTQFLAKTIYVILGLGVGFLGIKFLKEWFDLSKGKEATSRTYSKIKLSPFLMLFLISTIGLILSLLQSIWPTNYYILVFSMYTMYPGQSVVMGSLVLLYIFISLWFIGVVSLSTVLEKRNPRLFMILTAGILISSALGVLDIIFMKGYKL